MGLLFIFMKKSRTIGRISGPSQYERANSFFVSQIFHFFALSIIITVIMKKGLLTPELNPSEERYGYWLSLQNHCLLDTCHLLLALLSQVRVP